MLLWPPALCVALALALPATGFAKPSARYQLRPPSPVAGQPTTLDASATACDRGPCTYRWSTLRTRQSRRLRPLGRGKVLSHTFRRSGVRYLRLTVRNRKRQRSSKTRRIVVSEPPAPAPSPVPAPPESPAGVSLEEVDGGPTWYGRFANPLPTDPGYFPIGVWLQSVHTQAHINNDRDFGINTYVGVSDPEGTDKALMRANGMNALIQADERTRFTGIGHETAGWLLADEIDMTEGPGACGGRLQTIKNGLPADARLRYNNYGKGVLLWETDAEAACFVEAQDLQSTDLYWFTDPNQTDMMGVPWLPEGERQMTLSEVRRASNYGYQVDRMRALDARNGQRKPIWNFVELGWPWSETAAQGGRQHPAAGDPRGSLAQHHCGRARDHLLRSQLQRSVWREHLPRPLLPGEPGDGEIRQRRDQGPRSGAERPHAHGRHVNEPVDPGDDQVAQRPLLRVRRLAKQSVEHRHDLHPVRGARHGGPAGRSGQPARVRRVVQRPLR